jgi:zinc protease
LNISTRIRLSLVVLLVVACAGSAARAQKPVSAQKLPEIKYVKYTLPNGLTVITHEDHRLPLVAVDLW